MALLLVCALVLLAVAPFSWNGGDWRQRILRASILFGVLVAILTEGLSWLHALTFWGLTAAWGIVLVGLVLSFAGDAFLLSRARPAFLAGLVAFLLAHVAYAAAFAQVSRPSVVAAFLVLAVTGAVLRALWPALGGMRWPVVAYCCAIAAMLWLALGVDRGEVRAGALLFYLSDLAVARDRFLRPGLANRVVGLPLYYAGQLLLAVAAG